MSNISVGDKKGVAPDDTAWGISVLATVCDPNEGCSLASVTGASVPGVILSPTVPDSLVLSVILSIPVNSDSCSV